MLRRCRSKPARVLFKSIFFIFSTYRMRELHLCLLNRSGCSACVPPVSQYMEPKMPLQKQLELRHRAHSSSHRLQHWKDGLPMLGLIKMHFGSAEAWKKGRFSFQTMEGKIISSWSGACAVCSAKRQQYLMRASALNCKSFRGWDAQPDRINRGG